MKHIYCKKIRGSRHGQAMVEYVLLLAVIVGVVAIFGTQLDQQMAKVLKTYIEGIGSPKAATGGRALALYYRKDDKGTAGDAVVKVK